MFLELGEKRAYFSGRNQKIHEIPHLLPGRIIFKINVEPSKTWSMFWKTVLKKCLLLNIFWAKQYFLGRVMCYVCDVLCVMCYVCGVLCV